jgi:hypothetical protein
LALLMCSAARCASTLFKVHSNKVDGKRGLKQLHMTVALLQTDAWGKIVDAV